MSKRKDKLLPPQEYSLLAGFFNGIRESKAKAVTTAQAIAFLEEHGFGMRLSEASTVRKRLRGKGYLKEVDGNPASGRGNAYSVTQKGLVDIQVASAKFRHLARLVPEDELDAPGDAKSVPSMKAQATQTPKLVSDNTSR